MERIRTIVGRVLETLRRRAMRWEQVSPHWWFYCAGPHPIGLFRYESLDSEAPRDPRSPCLVLAVPRGGMQYDFIARPLSAGLLDTIVDELHGELEEVRKVGHALMEAEGPAAAPWETVVPAPEEP